MNPFKKTIKSLLRRFGYDVVQFTPGSSPFQMVKLLLDEYGIGLVFDVGANVGQYAIGLIEHGYKGKIVSFEPLSGPYRLLREKTRGVKKWSLAERCAIGEANKITTINISKNSVSSSILPILQEHINAEPNSIYIGSEEVQMYRLDEVGRKIIKEEGRPAFLKIDSQGYEDKVLEGAADILDKIFVMQIEMSIIPMYDGQRDFGQMLPFVKNLGYDLFGIFPGFTDVKRGRMYQIECIFVKKIN
ncbi:MAG: FkbM family methyltransferase [Candidatus Aminicenantales bacterium]